MECMTLAEIFATTIFSVKLMHDCICTSLCFDQLPSRAISGGFTNSYCTQVMILHSCLLRSWPCSTPRTSPRLRCPCWGKWPGCVSPQTQTVLCWRPKCHPLSSLQPTSCEEKSTYEVKVKSRRIIWEATALMKHSKKDRLKQWTNLGNCKTNFRKMLLL